MPTPLATTTPATGGVSKFSIDSGTGALTSLGAATAGLGSYAIATDPAGRFVYVANYTGVSVSGDTINASTGALTQIDADPATVGIQDFAAGGAGSYPSGIAVDPTGRFVYVTNDNTSITAYSINAFTGMLTHIDADPVTAGVHDVSSTRAFAIAIEPTGRWAYVTHSGGFNTVDVYSIDPITGVLTATGSSQATGSNPGPLPSMRPVSFCMLRINTETPFRFTASTPLPVRSRP